MRYLIILSTWLKINEFPDISIQISAIYEGQELFHILVRNLTSLSWLYLRIAKATFVDTMNTHPYVEQRKHRKALCKIPHSIKKRA